MVLTDRLPVKVALLFVLFVFWCTFFLIKNKVHSFYNYVYVILNIFLKKKGDG